LQKKLISLREHNEIVAANRQKRIPPKTTKLGGGIVIHGWLASGWRNDGNRNLTWGRISMRNADLVAFYDWVDVQTRIIIWK
jgi:hypothetical protein